MIGEDRRSSRVTVAQASVRARPERSRRLQIVQHDGVAQSSGRQSLSLEWR